MNQEWCGNELGQHRNEPRLLGMKGMNQDFQEWTRMFRNRPGLSGMNQDSSGLMWLSVKFCGSVKPTLINSLPLLIPNEPLPYHDFSNSIVHRKQHSPSICDPLDPLSEMFICIIHPYNATAFEPFLSKHNLSILYPLLVTNLKNGFPLGTMPALTTTVIIPNHPSTAQYPELVEEYLLDEVKAGRMSGPFSRHYVKKALRGPFFSSPLLVSVQTQGPGIPDKLRIC